MKTQPFSVTGFSLTEIMIALVISSILLYGVLSIMGSSRKTYGLQDELAKLQDNARFIVEDLTFTLRMAGFQGCSKNGTTPLGNKPYIEGENDETVANNIPPSDKITVRYLSDPLIWYEKEHYSPRQLARTGDTLYLDRDSYVPSVGEQVLISDCHGWESAKVTQSSASTSTQTGGVPLGTLFIKLSSLNRSYERPIDLYPVSEDGSLSSITYQVKPDPSSGFALYRIEEKNEESEKYPFVEGVESLQIRYAVKAGAGITYVDTLPNQLSDQVVGVRVTLLMRTAKQRFDLDDTTNREFKLDPNFTYNPYTENYDASKKTGLERGYRHRLFSSTIAIRNAEFL